MKSLINNNLTIFQETQSTVLRRRIGKIGTLYNILRLVSGGPENEAKKRILCGTVTIPLTVDAVLYSKVDRFIDTWSLLLQFKLI